MEEYNNIESSKEYIKVDPDRLIDEINSIKFQISTTKETYKREKLTTTYINNLFNTLNSIDELWNKTKQNTSKYINNFINIPSPNSIDITLDDFPVMTGSVKANSKVNISNNNEDNKKTEIINKNELIEIIEFNTNQEYAKIKTQDGKVLYTNKDNISLS